MATIIPSVCTEQQALTYSQQYPNLVFYTSDTGRIISNGGDVYGKDSISSPLIRVDGDVTVSLSALSGEMFDNTLTQSAAITASSTNTDVIYLATDTKAIIKAGVIYGGSVDVAKPFKFAPDLTDQSNWDTNYIYVVPSSTNILLYAYVSGAWANVSTQTIALETDASDISYDLTQTPDLGSGDVQSAIEAVDGKVEAVDGRIDDEKVEFIKERFPCVTPNWSSYGGTHWTQGTRSINPTTKKVISDYSSSYQVITKWGMVKKGTVIHHTVHSTASGYDKGGFPLRRTCVAWSRTDPDDYNTEHGTLVGFEYDGILIDSRTVDQDSTAIVPEDCYISYYRYNSGRTNEVFSWYANELLVDLYTEYYKKGVADGSGMASIAGLGYNVYDYISGEIDLEGFEYGCEIRRKYDKTPVASMQNAYKSNTSVVYFPKTDFSGCTSLNGAFHGASKLFIFPSIDVGTKSFTCLQCFRDATSLQYVGDFDGLTITNAEYMFQNCHALRMVGKIKLSASCSAANMFNTVSPNLIRVEELDVTAGCLLNTSSYNWNSGAKTGLRFMFIKGWGTHSSQTTLKVNNNWPVWGIATAEVPDARQSLIDTLLTYSFDRATAGYSACTVTLSANTKALLTTEEIEQITAKGYTIA